MKEKRTKRYSAKELSTRRGRSDWARVDALTDADIARAVRSDPDAVPIDIDWSKATIVMPSRKSAISIRLDEDVLDYFRASGSGYQSRMNAVLRHFVSAQKKKERA
jgi:uncharacterized protein (DUF4415 family)